MESNTSCTKKTTSLRWIFPGVPFIFCGYISVARWKIVYTRWANTMLILQSPWPMELQNTHCIRNRTGRYSARFCSSPVSQLFLGPWLLGTTKGTAKAEEHIYKGEETSVHDFRKIIIICMVILGQSMNTYVNSVYKQNFSCIHYAWYFGTNIPLCIWLNKECLLLNATLMFRSFLPFTEFLVTLTPLRFEETSVVQEGSMTSTDVVN